MFNRKSIVCLALANPYLQHNSHMEILEHVAEEEPERLLVLKDKEVSSDTVSPRNAA